MGLIAGGVLIICGSLATGDAGVLMVALGISLPGLLLQDVWRCAFVAEGRSSFAFLTDLLCLLVMLPASSLLCFMQKGPHSIVTATRIRSALSESLPTYMLPSRWMELDALPRNANGKIDRSVLRVALGAAG
jgi:acyl-CoA synthetase (AMP-forming)/AMP-acid ligase II